MSKKERKIEAVVFDMDGVLLDSEPYHELARQKMYQKYGVLDGSSLPQPVGKSTKDFWEEIRRAFDIEKEAAFLEQEQYENVLKDLQADEAGLSKGLDDLLELLKRKKIKIGLASSSTKYLVYGILRWKKIEGYFDEILTGDEVKHRKPNPEIYKKMQTKLAVTAKETLAIEDSFSGVLAAKKAGMFCVGYRNPTSGNQDLSMADVCINSLCELEGKLI